MRKNTGTVVERKTVYENKCIDTKRHEGTYTEKDRERPTEAETNATSVERIVSFPTRAEIDVPP